MPKIREEKNYEVRWHRLFYYNHNYYNYSSYNYVVL